MTDIVLVKNDEGKLEGFHKGDKHAYARLKTIIEEMEPGELISLKYWFKRDGIFHRKHMGMMRLFFESQETFDKYDPFRDWAHTGAGWVDWVPDPAGSATPIPIVKSIDYASADDEELHQIHEATKVFFRTEHAQRIMWPLIDANLRSIGAEGLLAQFEKDE